MQRNAEAKAEHRSGAGEDKVFAENIVRRLVGVKTQHLERRYLAYALGYVDIRQVIKHYKRQKSGAEDDRRNDNEQAVHHAAHARLGVNAQRHAANAVHIMGKSLGAAVYIRSVRCVCKRGLILRHFAELLLTGFRRDENEAVNIVIKQGADRNCKLLFFGGRQFYLIADFNSAELPGKVIVNCRFAPAGIVDGFSVIAKVNVLAKLLAVGHGERCVFDSVSAGHLRKATIEKHCILYIVSCVTEEYLLLFLIHVIRHRDLIIIEDYIIILPHHDILDSIVESERRKHKRGAAADAQKHHEYALFIAHDIARRYFLHEAHIVPHRGYTLEQNALSGLGRFRADELRRSTFEFLGAAIPCNKQRYQKVCGRYSKRQRPVHCERKSGKIVYQPVSEPDYRRERKASCRNAENTAQHGCAAGVKHVFSHNRAGGIAQRFHNAYLRALIGDHSRHRCKAHKRRDKKEKHREHGRHALDNVCVAFKADISRVCIAVEHIRIGVVDIFYLLFGRIKLGCALIKLCLCRIKLSLAGGKLLFSLGKASFGLCLALLILLFCRLKLCAAAAYHLARSIKLGLTGSDLGIACVKLSLCILKLLAIRLKLGIDLGALLTVDLKTLVIALNIRIITADTVVCSFDLPLYEPCL